VCEGGCAGAVFATRGGKVSVLVLVVLVVVVVVVGLDAHGWLAGLFERR